MLNMLRDHSATSPYRACDVFWRGCALELHPASSVFHHLQIGGVGVVELNRLELEMMRLLEYRLRVPACTIDQRVRLLLSRAEAKPGRREVSSAGGQQQHRTEDAADVMVESPQSSAAGAALSRVASQESVVGGGSPRFTAGSREHAAAGSGQGLGCAVGAAPGAVSAFQTGRPPLSFAAVAARPRLCGGSPPTRSSAGAWHYQPAQQQPQPQQMQQQANSAAIPAAAQEAPPVPAARQPSWPPASGALTAATPAPVMRSPSVPVSAKLRGNAGAPPSFAAVVAQAPKRGRASIDGGSGAGSRWQPAQRSERSARAMAPPVSMATAAAAHMGGGHVQRVPEGIKAC